jgi:hypothetical protein
MSLNEASASPVTMMAVWERTVGDVWQQTPNIYKLFPSNQKTSDIPKCDEYFIQNFRPVRRDLSDGKMMIQLLKDVPNMFDPREESVKNLVQGIPSMGMDVMCEFLEGYVGKTGSLSRVRFKLKSIFQGDMYI